MGGESTIEGAVGVFDGSNGGSDAVVVGDVED